MILNAPAKHPDSTKWYWLQWSNTELQGTTIVGAVWTLPPGLVMEHSSISGVLAGVKVSGGTLDDDYEVKLKITTSGDETLHEYLRIRCRKSGH
ncbi:MAG: hypothetical protein RPU51_09245 [Candidatus Sedimenticola sp. (ex Thyasira tokunagai)]